MEHLVREASVAVALVAVVPAVALEAAALAVVAPEASVEVVDKRN